MLFFPPLLGQCGEDQLYFWVLGIHVSLLSMWLLSNMCSTYVSPAQKCSGVVSLLWTQTGAVPGKENIKTNLGRKAPLLYHLLWSGWC